jgi:hypothetical protein
LGEFVFFRFAVYRYGLLYYAFFEPGGVPHFFVRPLVQSWGWRTLNSDRQFFAA